MIDTSTPEHIGHTILELLIESKSAQLLSFIVFIEFKDFLNTEMIICFYTAHITY